MNNELMVAELERDEGVRKIPYRDTRGILTIGVGHNMEVVPIPDDWTFPITDSQVSTLLSEDINCVVLDLNLHLPWWSSMDEVRQRVIVNMCFNMGIGTLLEFKNTLADMQTGDYVGAAAGMSASRWATQVGDRATRLISAMSSGVMPS
jgi:lysozyme